MDRLSVIFSALSDPTRRRILARLAKGEAYAGELAKPFDISQPAISRHLKVLNEAGLIEQVAIGQWRRCRLQPDGLKAASSWIEQYRPYWDEAFGRLGRYLDEMAQPQQMTTKRGKENGTTTKPRRAKRESGQG